MVTKKDGRTIRSGGIWAFLGKFSTSIMTLVINATLARILLTEELGLYFLVFNIAIFGAYVATAGFEQTVVKYVADSLAQNRPENVLYMIRTAFLGTLAGSAAVGVLYYLSSKVIASVIFNIEGLTAITLVLIFWMISNGFQVLIGESFRGFQNIKFATIFGGLSSTVIFIALLTIISRFDWYSLSIHSVIVLWITAISLSNVIGLAVLIKKLSVLKTDQHFSRKPTLTLKKIMPVTLPFMITALSYFFITQADIWMISMIGNQHDIAIYGAAAKLAILMSMPFIILNSVTQPMIASKFAAGRIKEFEKTLRTVTALAFIPAFLLFIVFVLLGDVLLTLIFGSEVYGNGALILFLLALKHLLVIWSGTAANLLAMTGYQRKLMMITIITGFISMAAAALAGQHYGGVGVALGFLIAGTLAQVYMIVSVYRALRIKGYADFTGIYSLVRKEIVRLRPARKLV